MKLTELLEKTEALCEKATPGPWKQFYEEITTEQEDIAYTASDRQLDDAEHIAHANPQTVKALCQVIRKLLEQRDAYMTDVISWPTGDQRTRKQEIAKDNAELDKILEGL